MLHLVLLWATFVNSYLLLHSLCQDCLSPYAILNHFAHWLTIITLITFAGVVLLTIVLRHSWLWVTMTLVWLVPGVIAFGFWYGENFLPRKTPTAEGVKFTVATYNVEGLASDANQTFAVIEQLDTDLVALQEFRPWLRAKITSEMTTEYPYQVSRYNSHGLLSRYPILDYEIGLYSLEGDLPFEQRRYVRAIIDMDGVNVVVYVLHIIAPKVAIPVYYNDTDTERQTRFFADLIAEDKNTAPVLVLCDCNFTPRTREYEIMDGVLDDTFAEVGRGFGLTFPSGAPLIRIDYVWYSEHFTAINTDVWNEGGTSDHRPVRATLVLEQQYYSARNASTG